MPLPSLFAYGIGGLLAAAVHPGQLEAGAFGYLAALGRGRRRPLALDLSAVSDLSDLQAWPASIRSSELSAAMRQRKPAATDGGAESHP
jgi:hypothetical protein